jgi:ABC-type transporter Mla subunit MlaD
MATTTNQGQQVKDKAKDAANTAIDKAGDFASKAADKASNFASQAADKAGEYASKAGEKADNAASSVGGSMKNLADTVRDNAPNSGMLGAASEQVASGLETGGKYLEDKGLSGIGDDLTGLIKNHPIPAVLIGIGIGYLIACSTSRS